MNRPMRKPWWLPQEDWIKLLEMHGGAPRCAICNTADNLSVDHIRSRRYGGPDDLGNLQFLCIPHNSRKGPRPDEYWSRRFYWDQTPNLSNMRTAQRLAFQSIVDDAVVSDWFSQPMNATAGRIYLLAWVVGAGKTLGIPSVAFAVNHLMRREWGEVRRADRILVLAKEEAIRDQLAADLKEDLVKYNITTEAPRVGVVHRGDTLHQREWLDQQDIVVACIQQLWDRNGQSRSNLAEILDHFPLIFVDEPHWGAEQVRNIIDAAYRSLVFGLTGSPVTSTGKLLNDFVLLSSFTYQDACDNDQSLKYLSDNEAVRDLFLYEVAVSGADLLSGGQSRRVETTTDPDYDVHQLEPAKNVVEEAVRHLISCDNEAPFAFGQPADHRLGDVVPDLFYSAHALIACDDIGMARRLCESTNALLDANRKTYPRDRGWSAEVVHSDASDLDGQRLAGQRLGPDHPWMRSKTLFDEAKLTYQVDAKCSRILFVVGMAREGVNNPLCSVVGATYRARSLPGVVQRHLGRQLRVPTIYRDGVLHVPPARLDTVRVITHQANDATDMIVKAMQFICNMSDALADLPTVNDLANGTAHVVEPQDVENGLMLKERFAVADFVADRGGTGDWRRDGETVKKILDDAVKHFSDGNPQRAAKVADWITTLVDEPAEARRRCRIIDQLDDIPTVATVVREDERHEPNVEELRTFIRKHHPDLAPYAGEDHPGLITSFREHYRSWAESISLPPVRTDTDIETIRRSLARNILNDLAPYIEGDRKKAANMAHSLVGAAVKRLLGVPEDESAGKQGKYDTPQSHVVVLRQDNRQAIDGFVRAQMIRKGFCPRLSRAFGLDLP